MIYRLSMEQLDSSTVSTEAGICLEVQRVLFNMKIRLDFFYNTPDYHL